MIIIGKNYFRCVITILINSAIAPQDILPQIIKRKIHQKFLSNHLT